MSEELIRKLLGTIGELEMPHPDTEAMRVYWDDETQSIKREIIPLADMWATPEETDCGEHDAEQRKERGEG